MLKVKKKLQDMMNISEIYLECPFNPNFKKKDKANQYLTTEVQINS